MKTKKLQFPKDLPLAKLSFPDVKKEWVRQRREYFNRLAVDGWTHRQIAELHGVTRQAVAMLIGNVKKGKE